MESSDKIRVLIADDSFFIRRFLSELLISDPQIEVVGTASTGDEVVRLAFELKPDVITMDYHMPGKNGIEAAAAIMLGEKPLPAIIMLSAFDGKDGQAVRRSLEESGAQVITKPSGEVSLDIDKIASEVILKIKEVGELEVRIRKALARIHQHANSRPPATGKDEDLRTVVVIGASTGGPPLVELLLSSLDPHRGIAVVIAQHMSKYFTELFAERLNRVTHFDVCEATNGHVLTPGKAVVIPGGLSLGANDSASPENNDKVLSLVAIEPTKSEDEIDRAMEAIALRYGKKTCGVLLSGMGVDGSRGLRFVKEHGGYTIVQDPKTATLASMPEHALAVGVADAVLPVETIADQIHKHFV